MQLDANSTCLSEEKAATKIQAGFRGYRVRKELKEKQTVHPSHKVNNTNCCNIDCAVDKTNENQINNNQYPMTQRRNNSIEERSATKIQAGIRGYLVRKRQRLATEAATKIQAGFRAFKARKEVKKIKGASLIH